MAYITGDMDTASTTARLDSEIGALASDGHLHFVFNLENTAYLDSAGISVFIHCLCNMQERKGTIAIVAQDNQVRRVLEMVGIHRLITIYDSMQDYCIATGESGPPQERPPVQ